MQSAFIVIYTFLGLLNYLLLISLFICTQPEFHSCPHTLPVYLLTQDTNILPKLSWKFWWVALLSLAKLFQTPNLPTPVPFFGYFGSNWHSLLSSCTIDMLEVQRNQSYLHYSPQSQWPEIRLHFLLQKWRILLSQVNTALFRSTIAFLGLCLTNLENL